ncbi:hypothetical protein OG535_03305 [Kitasatospora sp. NBC_00085]|uniref:hypothetical protein n=1 Tax=unclassified Kitasatospora TaxID=2633591 RepID=UPI002F913B9B
MGGRQRPPRARGARPGKSAGAASARVGGKADGRPAGGGGRAEAGSGRVDPKVEIARLEGYLAWEAEVSAAERDARAFADRFPWLSPGERESLEQAYAADRLRYAEDVVDRAVERCRQLAARYRGECRRICARWAALCLSVTFAAALCAVVPAALRG